MRTKNEKGFVELPLLLAFVAGLVVGAGVMYLGTKNSSRQQLSANTQVGIPVAATSTVTQTVKQTASVGSIVKPRKQISTTTESVAKPSQHIPIATPPTPPVTATVATSSPPPATDQSRQVALLQQQIQTQQKTMEQLQSQIYQPPQPSATIGSVKTLPITGATSSSVVMSGWVSDFPALVTFDIGEGENFSYNKGKSIRLLDSNSASVTIENLFPAAKYYYRVSAVALTGNYKTYGETFSFTTPKN